MAKIKLIENFNLDIKPDNVVLYENNKTINFIENIKFEAIGILKNVDITRFIINLNNRLYPKKLWEKVCKEKTLEGTKCYANHPENEADVTKQVGIWHNFRIDENTNTGKADLYLIGEYGKLLLESLKAGSKGEGFSSVGFGEEEDREDELKLHSEMIQGKDVFVVKWDNFMPERAGDWVESPSQNVYATANNIINISKKSEVFNENLTNKIEDNKIENKKEVNNMDRLMELNHRNQVKEAIRQAAGSDNLKESIERLSSIETESEDLKKSINDEIKNLQIKLNEQRENAEKSLSEKTAAFDELQEKYDTAVKVVDELKAKVDRIGKIQEIFEIAEDADIGEVEKQKNSFVEDYTIVCENVKAMEKDIEAVSAMFETDEFKEMEVGKIEDVKNLVEDTLKREADIEWLYTSLKEAENTIGKYEELMEDAGIIFEADKKDDEKDDKEDGDKEDKDKDKKEEEDDKEDKDKKDNKEDEDKEDNKKEKKEEIEKSDVEIFIEREIEKKPSLKDIEDTLKSCKTLAEAIDHIDTFNSKDIEEPVKFKESKEEEVEDYKVEKYVFSYNR
jgi:hypothetical protein